MFSKIIKLIIVVLITTLFFFIFKYYFSEKNFEIIKNNRQNIQKIINESIPNLPTLNSDTNNVIEFNSGFEDNEKKTFKRNFWELFK